jgi:hypothetical protein
MFNMTISFLEATAGAALGHSAELSELSFLDVAKRDEAQSLKANALAAEG